MNEQTITYGDVKQRVLSLVKQIDRDAAVQALAVFSVTSATHLVPEEWSDFCEYADGLLASHERNKREPAQTLGDLLRQVLERPPVLKPKYIGVDLAKQDEPKRAPLDWNKSTPFDQFKGFKASSFHNWKEGEERADHASPFGEFRSPDMAASSHQVDWKHGTAHR